MKNLLLIMLLVLFSHSVFATENSESFLLSISNNVIGVVPAKNKRKVETLILENQTMTKILGQIQTLSGEIKKTVVSYPGTSTSTKFKYKDSDGYVFVPLVPPGRSIALKVGMDPYEISAKTQGK